MKWLLILSLTTGLSSSSFFLPQYLSYLIAQQDISEQQLAQAKSLRLPAYYHYQRSHHQIGSPLWLRASQVLALKSASIAYELAEIYQHAAEIERAIFWYHQAIKLNSTQARLSLADLMISQKSYQSALATLAPLVQSSEQATIHTAKLNIALGQVDELQLLLPVLAKFPAGLALLKKITKYRMLGDVFSHYTTDDKGKEIASCIADIQMFAVSLADLDYTARLILQFQEHPLSAYVCFSPVRYLNTNDLDCYHKKQAMIRCHNRMWIKQAKSITTTYIGLMLPQGGANVNAGIMYLDSRDTVDVLAHEVAHLLGFIDEYPLPENHAKCAQPQLKPFAHNIAVLNLRYQGQQQQLRREILSQVPWRLLIADDTPIMTVDKDTGEWRLGTPSAFEDKIGLFVSATCQKKSVVLMKETTPFAAFKPIKSHSQLSYFELDFPVVYQQLLAADRRRFMMPSVQSILAD